MITWDDSQTIFQDLSSDNSASSLTFYKRLANVGYKIVLAELGLPIIEKTQTALTRAPSSPLVELDRSYQLPPDFLFIKSLIITIGSRNYIITEEESQEMWNYRTQILQTGIPEVYFVRPGFGFSGAEFLLDPIPSAVNYTMTLIYEASGKDLSQDKYTTGTCDVTTGSASVTGTTTVWIGAMLDRYFKVTSATGDGLYYRIIARSSNTAITLENVYEGTTQSGVNYEIVEIFSLPEEMQVLPVYFALEHYFAIKKDINQERKYLALFIQGLEAGKLRHATKSRGAIIREKGIRRWKEYPSHFPTEIS